MGSSLIITGQDDLGAIIVTIVQTIEASPSRAWWLFSFNLGTLNIPMFLWATSWFFFYKIKSWYNSCYMKNFEYPDTMYIVLIYFPYNESRAFEIILRGKVDVKVLMKICHHMRDGQASCFAGRTITLL